MDNYSEISYIRSVLGESIMTDDFTNWLLEINYFNAPASSIEKRNYPGALFNHSKEVAIQLMIFTSSMNLTWLREESPWIIGLFHDIIKADDYCFNMINPRYRQGDRLINGKYKYSTNPDDHGNNSILMLKDKLELTDEEIFCIRFHQGAFTDKDRWQQYNDAIRKYPNVLFTHTADMIASQLTELEYNYRY